MLKRTGERILNAESGAIFKAGITERQNRNLGFVQRGWAGQLSSLSLEECILDFQPPWPFVATEFPFPWASLFFFPSQSHNVSQGSPSTCTLDTAIVPLPSFCLVVVFLLLFLRPKKPLENTIRLPYPPWAHNVYFVLVLAALAMTILEIARLSAEKLGVSLLPMTPVALLIILIVLWIERRGRTRAMSYVSDTAFLHSWQRSNSMIAAPVRFSARIGSFWLL